MHVGDVADVDGRPAGACDDEVEDLGGVVELAVDADEVVLRARRPPSRPGCWCSPSGRRDEVVDAEVVALERREVHVDLHLALEPAEQVHAADARDALDLVLQVLGRRAERGQAALREEVDGEDGEVGEVDVGHDGLLDVRRELGLGEVHGLADLAAGLVDVLVGEELGDDRRDALGARAPDLIEAGDRRDLALDLLRDDRLDVVRAGAGVDRGDDDLRELDLRLALLGERDVRDEPADRERQREDDDGRPVADREVGDFHGTVGRDGLGCGSLG